MSRPGMRLPAGLLRLARRDLLGHGWQTGLAVLGVALGVAVVVAVQLANQSAARSFELSRDALAGEATHRVVAGPSGLPDSLYADLSRAGLGPAAPVVEAQVTGKDGRGWRVLGVDAFAEMGLRPALGAVTTAVDMGEWLTRPGRGVILAETAESLGLEEGDEVALTAAGRERAVRIQALLEPDSPTDRAGLADTLILDIAAAQELLDRVGQIDRIDLRAPENGTEEWERQLRERIPGDARLLRIADETAALDEMTAAFRLNLNAFSLLALVVGGFLIYNTASFSVVRRRTRIGLLRAIGVTRRQVFLLVLGESLLIGLVGALIGLLLGMGLAHGLVDLVARTIDDLYFRLEVRQLHLTPGVLAMGPLLGILVSFLGALVPAREATAVPPRAALARSGLESGWRRALPWLLIAGVGLLFASLVVLAVSGESLLLAFGGLFLLLMGAALLVPPVGAVLLLGLAKLAGWMGGYRLRLAARGVVAGLSRSGVAMAALALAVAAVVGVAVMVDSFRTTFSGWLEVSLPADIYVTAPSPTGESVAIDPRLVTRLAEAPGVAHVTTIRSLRVGWQDRAVRMRVHDFDARGREAFAFKEGEPEAAFRALAEEGALWVTEPFARHHELSAGDSLSLATPAGEREFAIAAVVHDYGTSEGAVLMHRRAWLEHWPDPGISGMGIHLQEGIATETARAALAEAVRDQDPVANEGGLQQLRLQSNRELRTASLEVFDRTFTITHVLRLLAVLVAVVGIFSALLALSLERAREYAVLRATGLTPGELGGTVVLQTGLTGLIAGLCALPTGVVLAAALAGVINERAFGWTLELAVDPAILLQAVGLAVAAGLLAGLYPAWRLARQPATGALREAAT